MALNVGHAMRPRAASMRAILVGALVSFAGAVLVLLSLLFLTGLEVDAAWGRYGRKALFCDLLVMLASAVAGGFVTSLCTETGKLGHSVVLGIVLLVSFLLAACFCANWVTWRERIWSSSGAMAMGTTRASLTWRPSSPGWISKSS